MKFFLLALFVAAVAAKPAPLDEDNQAVEVIVNGVPEGQALELGGIVDLKLKEHVNGELTASSDLLHSYTAVGLAEAAAAAVAAEAPKPDYSLVDNSIPESPIPSPVVMPSPVSPEVSEVDAPIPSPVVMPPPVAPEVSEVDAPIPSPVVMPPPIAPEVSEVDAPIPSPVVMPPPIAPEVSEVDAPLPSPIVISPEIAPEVAEVVPEPAAQLPFGEIYNDGLVQVNVNAPQDPGVFATLQSWFNMAVNYFNNGVQTSSQQIV